MRIFDSLGAQQDLIDDRKVVGEDYEGDPILSGEKVYKDPWGKLIQTDDLGGYIRSIPHEELSSLFHEHHEVEQLEEILELERVWV